MRRLWLTLIRTLESAFERVYDDPAFTPKLRASVEQSIPLAKRAKSLFKQYRQHSRMPDSWIVEVACAPHASDLQRFAEDVLVPFLTIQAGTASGAPAAAS